MRSMEPPVRPSVGFWSAAAARAEAFVVVLMHGAEDTYDGGAMTVVTHDIGVERTFDELEDLFAGIAHKLQNFTDADGHLDVPSGAIFSCSHIMQLEIGGYDTDSRMLTVQITRRRSLKAAWAVLKVPVVFGRGWWVTELTLEEPPSWAEMKALAEA